MHGIARHQVRAEIAGMDRSLGSEHGVLHHMVTLEPLIKLERLVRPTSPYSDT